MTEIPIHLRIRAEEALAKSASVKKKPTWLDDSDKPNNIRVIRDYLESLEEESGISNVEFLETGYSNPDFGCYPSLVINYTKAEVSCTCGFHIVVTYAGRQSEIPWNVTVDTLLEYFNAHSDDLELTSKL